jgi:hypothetical protein
MTRSVATIAPSENSTRTDFARSVLFRTRITVPGVTVHDDMFSILGSPSCGARLTLLFDPSAVRKQETHSDTHHRSVGHTTRERETRLSHEEEPQNIARRCGLL